MTPYRDDRAGWIARSEAAERRVEELETPAATPPWKHRTRLFLFSVALAIYAAICSDDGSAWHPYAYVGLAFAAIALYQVIVAMVESWAP